jgi:hypothetical protein
MDMQRLMKQAQKMQQQAKEVQRSLAKETVEGSAGGGAVRVVATGSQEIRSVHIDPEAVSGADSEMLEDLVLAAVNDALTKSKALAQEALARVTGQLQMPPLG